MTYKHIKRPELFQGDLQKKHYFEGWYFKHVTADCANTIAFIPGISIDDTDSHSFVQVIVSPNIKTYYFKYPIESFRTTDDPFSVSVGDNVFSMEGCKIALHDDKTGVSFTGETHFSEIKPIESSILMPNIMGYFAYIPNMECKHGVISMNHLVKGHVTFSEGDTLNFDGGKGYLEKDWGTSFPMDYIWIQANHFESATDSFMCSIANIPFGLFSFKGLIANLHFEGVEYRFATYNRSKFKNLKIDANFIQFDLVKGDITLTCEAKLTEAGALKAPEKGEMLRTIKEGLGGEVVLVLKRKGLPDRTLKSTCAGIEIVNPDQLLY